MSIDYLKDMLRRHEGVRNRPYLCPAGKNTIGVGWNMDANKLPNSIASYLRLHGFITEEMIDQLLDISIETATNQCRNIYPKFDDYSEARRFALIDFVFNVGIGTALKFRNMLAAIKVNNWNRAADEMYYSQWSKQVGDRAVEVIGMVRNG